MVESRAVRIALRVASALAIAFLYLPLVILAIYAFNPSRLLAGRRVASPLSGSARRLRTRLSCRAVVNSLLAGTVATGVALVLGTLAAFAVQRFSFFGRESISFLFVIPIALPGVVTGIALRTTFVTFGVDFGLMTIIIGHATFCVVIVYNNVIARLRRLPRSPGGGIGRPGRRPATTFRRITLPGIGTALLSGGLLAFALSFDEVIVTIFTAGPGTQTIPMWILHGDRRPTELPVVNVVALVLVVASIVPVYLAQRISGGAAAGVAR